MYKTKPNKWPKKRQVLTLEQQSIFIDWYKFWLSQSGMPGKFSFIDRWGHNYAAKNFSRSSRVLEIGAGTGSHLDFEKVDLLDYYAIENNNDLSRQILTKNHDVHVYEIDCQHDYPFPDNFFDRVIAIHVLEHLDNLPQALSEIYRVLKPNGFFSVVIPCEGGTFYNLGRFFTSERLFKKRYKVNYDWFIKYDHINTGKEVLDELDQLFIIRKISHFPLFIPLYNLNLVLGITCKPRKE